MFSGNLKYFIKFVSLVLVLSLFLENLAYAKPDQPSSQFHDLEIPNSIGQIEEYWKAESEKLKVSSSSKATKWPRREGNVLDSRLRRSLEQEDSPSALRSTSHAPRSPLIYLIQDAHTNESAQRNITKILDRILREKKVQTVFLEGGSGDDSLSALRQLGSPKKRLTLANQYLKKGLIQGPDFLDLTSSHDFKLWGVEDKALYHEALLCYQFLKDRRENLNAYLDRVRQTAEALERHVLNPRLLAFHSQKKSFEKGELALTDYLDIPVLRNLKSLESKINFEEANKEQARAVLSLTVEDQKELMKLSSKSHSPFKFSNTNHQPEQAFFLLLEEKLTRNMSLPKSKAIPPPSLRGVPPLWRDDEAIPQHSQLSQNNSILEFNGIASGTSCPRNDVRTFYLNLTLYFDYLKQAREIDPESLLKEQKVLEQSVTSRLIQTREEKDFLQCEQALQSMKGLVNLTLTPEEFESIQSSPKQYDFASIGGSLNRMIMDLGAHYERAVFLDENFEAACRKAVRFYELSKKRDEKFVENMLSVIARSPQGDEAIPSHSPTVLITGGFHTQNLKALLKQHNISYLSIRPEVLQETNQKKYEAILLGPAPAFNGAGLGFRNIAVLPGRELEFLSPTGARLSVYEELAKELGGNQPDSRQKIAGMTLVSHHAPRPTLHVPRITLLTLVLLIFPVFMDVLLPSQSFIQSISAQQPPPVAQNGKDVEALIKRLTESADPADKIDAANRLGNLKDRRAVPDLKKRLLKESRPDVKEAIIMTLGKIGDASAVREIMSTICDKKCDRTLESRGKIAINMMDSDEVIPQLELAIRGNFWAVPDSVRNNPAELQKYEFANNQAVSKALSIARVSNSQDLKRRLGPSFAIAVEHENTTIKREAIKNLTELKDPQYTAPVLGKINDNDEEVKEAVEKFFKTLGESAIPELLKAWEAYPSTEPKDKFEAILSYVLDFVSTTAKDPAVQRGSAAGLLRIALATENLETQKKAIETLLRFTQELSSPTLTELLKSGAWSVERDAWSAKFLKSDSPQIRSIGITAVSQVKTEDSAKALLPFLADPDYKVRQVTKEALIQIGLPHPGIKDAFTHKNPEVRQAARDILRSLKVYGFWEWFWFSLTSYLWQIITSIVLTIASIFGITKTKWYKHRKFVKHQGKRHQAYLSFLDRHKTQSPDKCFLLALKERKTLKPHDDYVLNRTLSDLISYLFPNETELTIQYPKDIDEESKKTFSKGPLDPKLIPALLQILEGRITIPTFFRVVHRDPSKVTVEDSEKLIIPDEADRTLYFKLKAAEILIKLMEQEAGSQKPEAGRKRVEDKLVSILLEELEQNARVLSSRPIQSTGQSITRRSTLHTGRGESRAGRDKSRPYAGSESPDRTHEYNALNTAFVLSRFPTSRAQFYADIANSESFHQARDYVKDLQGGIIIRNYLELSRELMTPDTIPALQLRALWFFNEILGEEVSIEGVTRIRPRAFHTLTPEDQKAILSEALKAEATLKTLLKSADQAVQEQAKIAQFILNELKKPAPKTTTGTTSASAGPARTVITSGPTANTIQATLVGAPASQAPIPMKPKADGATIADEPKVKVDPKGPTIPDIPIPQAQGTIIVTKPIGQILIVGLNPNQEIIYKMGFKTHKLPDPIFKKTPKEANEYLKSEQGKAVGLVVLLQDQNPELKARRQAFAQYLKDTFNLPTFFIDSESITQNPGLVLSQLKAIVQQANGSFTTHPSPRSTVAARLAREANAKLAEERGKRKISSSSSESRRSRDESRSTLEKESSRFEPPSASLTRTRTVYVSLEQELGQSVSKVSHPAYHAPRPTHHTPRLTLFLRNVVRFNRPVSSLNNRLLPVKLAGRKVYVIQLRIEDNALVAVAEGIKIRLSSRYAPRFTFHAPRSPQDIRNLKEAVSAKVISLLDKIKVDDSRPVIVRFQLDLMDNGYFEEYFEDLLRDIRQIKKEPRGKNAHFKVAAGRLALIEKALNHPKAKGLFIETTPEDLKDAPQVDVVLAGSRPSRGVLQYAPTISLPVKFLEAGDVPIMGVVARLAITLGRIDLSRIPELFIDAYSTLAGERADLETLRLIFQGEADLKTVLRFALKALVHVTVNQFINTARLAKKIEEMA